MNNIEYFTQIQDESMELGSVDSDYPLDFSPTNFIDPSTMLSYQAIGQGFHLEPLAQEDISLSSFIDPADTFNLGIDVIPEATNDLSSIGFSGPIVDFDQPLNHLDPTLLNIANSTNQLPGVYETWNGVYSADISPFDSLDLDFTL
jgi:hypothetical protein